jgi:hypothetical protein
MEQEAQFSIENFIINYFEFLNNSYRWRFHQKKFLKFPIDGVTVNANKLNFHFFNNKYFHPKTHHKKYPIKHQNPSQMDADH